MTFNYLCENSLNSFIGHFWNELSRVPVPVPVPTKIFQLVASISWKRADYGYEPRLYYSLPVFFLLSFCFLVTHCSHVSLPYLSSDDGSIFLCFSFCGVLGLLLCLKSKKQKVSDSLPSLMGSYKSYLHAYLCQNFWVNS